jgi:uncharacterized protein
VKPRHSFLPALAGLLLVLATGLAAQTPTPTLAPPQRWLTDAAGLLSPGTAAELDARLEEYEKTSGHQIVVYIGGTTGGVPIEDWAVKAFESWRVGRKGLDDGLALFVMVADRRMRIEVGYGLESVVPDALAARVINDEMVPRLQSGDNDGAVRAAIERLIGIISGDSAARGSASGSGEAEPGPARPMTLFEKVLIGIAILGFLLLLITNPSLAIYLLFSILSGGRGGGGGGGGFSGGGGRSGGGGASRSW